MVLDYLQINELTIEEKSNSFFRLIKDRGSDYARRKMLKAMPF
jgi:hypothetical protein